MTAAGYDVQRDAGWVAISVEGKEVAGFNLPADADADEVARSAAAFVAEIGLEHLHYRAAYLELAGGERGMGNQLAGDPVAEARRVARERMAAR